MQMRPLGRSGLTVSALCFGGNVFGWTTDEATSHALLDRYADGGGNFVDTANVYSRWVPGHTGGESESVIGRWLKKTGRRKDIVLASKVGMDMPGLGKGLTAAQIERGCDDSLRRLQVDRIDLYYAHADDPDTPLEETLGAFDRLVKAGKVGAIAASNYTAERLEAALSISAANGWARYECLQPPYNLMDRADYDARLYPVCERHGLATAPYYGLASGFLSGKYRKAEDAAGKARSAGVSRHFGERGWRVLAALDEVSKALGTSPATVAVAWAMARPGITSAIASATSVAQLDELLQAGSLQFGAREFDALNMASAA